MKASKKITLSLLASAAVCASVIGLSTSLTAVKTSADAKTDVSRYYYSQLSIEEKRFYDAIDHMEQNGILKNGQDYEITSLFPQEAFADFAGGNSAILKQMAGARDAYYFDNCDVFYVDFSYLSLRVTSKGSEYHAYIGSGRDTTYYSTGFSNAEQIDSAIVTYKNALDSLVSEAKLAQPAEGETAEVAQIRHVHAALSKMTKYRLETQCTPGNEGHVRTVYGAFVKGESLCEGYSRAFKAAMDELGIPCVLVQGVYRHGNDHQELHMWNYVELEGKWYAVDLTFDDLDYDTKANYIKKTEGDAGYYYFDEYFLRGEGTMARQHVPNGILSEANHEFVYPTLAENDYFSTFSADNGIIRVSQKKNSVENSSDIEISLFIDGEYLSQKQAAEKGYYLLMRHTGYYDPEHSSEQSTGVWGYINAELVASFEDHDGYSILKDESKSLGFEFAITDKPPRPYEDVHFSTDEMKIMEHTTYLGDPHVLVSQTDFIETVWGDPNYFPAPHIRKATPAQSGSLDIGRSYHVVLEYDQKLELIDPTKPVGISLTGYMPGTGEVLSSTNQYASWGNAVWNADEPNKFEFDFTPSPMYAHDSVYYTFQPTNLIGLTDKAEKKIPNAVTYFLRYPCASCAYTSRGYDWNVYGRPTLIENSDMSMNDWVADDGTSIEDMKALSHRMALVVTDTTALQESEMQSEIDKEGAEVLKSETYNIKLTLCKAQVIKTGQGVRVMLGFPDGYGPDDEGVTFKAYHFTTDAQGHITGKEELECVVTQYGLVVLCKSFSPFAVVVESGSSYQAGKAVLVSSSEGGKVEGPTMFSLANTSSTQKLSVVADEGYSIESITIGGKAIEITDPSTMTVDVKYVDIAGNQGFVEAKFVANNVLKSEQEKGESVVTQTIKSAEITLKSKLVKVNAGETISIKATVKSFGDAVTYQWYKDDHVIAGAHSDELVIENAKSTDSGSYTLVVTSSSGVLASKAESEVCQVIVSNPFALSDDEKLGIIVAASLFGLCLLLIVVTLVARKIKSKKQNKTK